MEPYGALVRVYPMHQPNGRVMTLPEPDHLPEVVVEPEILEITVVPTEISDHGFDRFYRVHHNRIAKGLAFSLGDVDLAAEATDEAFVRAYERWAKVQR